MKAIILILCSMFFVGCTSYSGISKADKTGSYYITSNTVVFWVTPNVNLCEAESGKKGDLKCRQVKVKFN